MVVNAIEVGVLVRQLGPLTASAQHVPDGGYHRTHSQGHWSPRSLPGCPYGSFKRYVSF
jgi:hypothetical protein